MKKPEYIISIILYAFVVIGITYSEYPKIFAFDISSIVEKYRVENDPEMIKDIILKHRHSSDKYELQKAIYFIIYIFYENQDYDSAVEIEEHLNKLRHDNLLFYNALFLIAASHKEMENYEKAVKIFYEILHNESDMILIRKSVNKLLKIFKASDHYDMARKLVEAYSQYDWYGSIEESIEIFIAEHEIKNGEHFAAAKRLLKLYRIKASLRTKRGLKAALDEIRKRDLNLLSRHDLLLYYLQEREFKKANEVLGPIINQNPSVPFYDIHLKNKLNYTEYEKRSKGIYNRIRNTRHQSATALYKSIYTNYPYSYYAEMAMFRDVAQKISSGKFCEAAEIYSYIKDHRKNSRNYGLFWVRTGILNLISGNTENAMDIFKQLQYLDSNVFQAIARYFKARNAYQEQNNLTGNGFINKILYNNFNTYYSFHAEQLIRQNPNFSPNQNYKQDQNKKYHNNLENLIYIQYQYRSETDKDLRMHKKEIARQYIQQYFYYYTQRDKMKIHRQNNAYFRKYLLLKDIGIYEQYIPYLQYIHNNYDNAYITELLLKELYEKGENLHAISIGTRYINQMALTVDFRLLPENIQKVLFPVKYHEIITKYAENIDPLMIMALIRQESGFNKNAVSPKNAVGLMQVLPSTAAQVARRNRIPYRGRTDLFDEETNIRIGIAYLESLYERYDRNIHYMLAAYNAGGRHATRWRNMYDGPDMDIFTFIITFKETREYVQLILRNHLIYKAIIHDE